MFYKPWFCRFLQRFFRGKPGDTAVLVGFYGDSFLKNLLPADMLHSDVNGWTHICPFSHVHLL